VGGKRYECRSVIAVGVLMKENVLESRGRDGTGLVEFNVATLSERSVVRGRGDLRCHALSTSSCEAKTRKITGPTVPMSARKETEQ
jgi:hypothetical protein